MGCPWAVHGRFMGSACAPSGDELPMGLERSWGVRGLPIVRTWVSMGCPWTARAMPMGCAWAVKRDAHGLPMGCQWTARGILIGCLWGAYGLSPGSP